MNRDSVPSHRDRRRWPRSLGDEPPLCAKAILSHVGPEASGINLSKRHLFVESFEFPPGWGEAKRAKSTPKPKATRPRKTEKQRNNRKINRPTLTPEEKVQRRREYEQKRRQLPEVKERIRFNTKARYWKDKELGLYKEHCGEPATPGQTSIHPIWHCQLAHEPRQDATLGIDEGLWDVRWSWCRRSTESGWQHRKRDGSGR